MDTYKEAQEVCELLHVAAEQNIYEDKKKEQIRNIQKTTSDLEY